MEWYIVAIYPNARARIESFPFYVGRHPEHQEHCLLLPHPTVSRSQFVLEARQDCLLYRNLSRSAPAKLDGATTDGERLLAPGIPHVLRMGNALAVIGSDTEAVERMATQLASERYIVNYQGVEYGPLKKSKLSDYFQRKILTPTTLVWCLARPSEPQKLSEIIDCGPAGPAPAQPPTAEKKPGGPAPNAAEPALSGPKAEEAPQPAKPEKPNPPPAEKTEEKQATKPEKAAPAADRPAPKEKIAEMPAVAGEETATKPGERFTCPYCRTVAEPADVLSVAVSPTLLGDPVLGESEPRRFLPSKFTGNGLALDPEGGVCTEIACPRCHMTLPRALLSTPQIVMSVIGAAGAGKSVFLASALWQCRQMLRRLFGVSFMDLDPAANRWVNAYEERLFFQEDGQALQQIEKTDLQAANVCRTVTLDGDSVLLPLPGFFQLHTASDPKPKSLVVYDSAGEHFRAGADAQSSTVTLNMLNANALFFMFDPSADPRFRSMLDLGKGTAHNHAQRQDVLLAEMAARIRRHLGNRGENRLTRPLLFGVSKADLLQAHLPLTAELYRPLDGKRHALDLKALRKVSEATEALLAKAAPEVAETAHDIASDVWFLPVSALGHNPLREGVRPCDIKPIWAELPIVFTLARQGLIPTVEG